MFRLSQSGENLSHIDVEDDLLADQSHEEDAEVDHGVVCLQYDSL